MYIEGLHVHLSIKPFPAVETPDFVVVIGPNGSGKTQLLQALAYGMVVTDRTAARPPSPMPNPDVVLLTNYADEAGPLQPLQQTASSSYFVQSVPTTSLPAPPYMNAAPELDWNFRDALLTLPRRALAELTEGKSEEFAKSGRDLWDEGPDGLADSLDYPAAHVVRTKLAETFQAAASRLVGQNIPSDMTYVGGFHVNPILFAQFRSKVVAAAEALELSPLAVTLAQASEVGSWGGYSPYAPNVNQLMAAYRDARLKNDLQHGQDAREGSKLALTPEQFIANFGPPPWAQISAVLQSFGLDYEIAAPSMRPIDPVSFSLKKPDEPVYVVFGALSSGEKVLVQLALSLFAADPLRTSINKPQLLLLDEKDASLHPEVLHRWLTALREKVVVEQGIATVLTTHSPVTVAMVPEESIFELRKGEPGLHKVTKQEALNRLTIGLPALSVDFSRRRQVLVESDIDAALYDGLVNLMKARLKLSMTLNFMGTGLRKGKNEIGTGSSVVRQMVQNFVDAKNQSVFGVVDWDKKNVSDDRVRVLAAGSHYAIENVLLDPMLVGALLLRQQGRIEGIEHGFVGLERATSADRQALADFVQLKLKYPEGAEPGQAANRYHDGVEVAIDRAFLTSNGHEIEDALVEAHPSLRAFTGKGRGALMQAVVDRVLYDLPDWTPAQITSLLQELAN